MDIPELVEGQTVQVLWADLPLWLARRHTEDNGRWWEQTMPAVLASFHLSLDDYWDLTVADHAQFTAHLGLTPEAADGQQP